MKMKDILHTSYKSEGFHDLITAIVKIANPKLVVELGVQQARSTIAIAKGLRHGVLEAYDLFEEKYSEYPNLPTSADYEASMRNIKDAGVEDKVQLSKGDAFKAHLMYESVDILHIDLCNHYDNVLEVLENWYDIVNILILIEGGVYNHWQAEYGFKSFNDLFEMGFIKDNYDKVILKADESYALTILARKEE